MADAVKLQSGKYTQGGDATADQQAYKIKNISGINPETERFNAMGTLPTVGTAHPVISSLFVARRELTLKGNGYADAMVFYDRAVFGYVAPDPLNQVVEYEVNGTIQGVTTSKELFGTFDRITATFGGDVKTVEVNTTDAQMTYTSRYTQAANPALPSAQFTNTINVALWNGFAARTMKLTLYRGKSAINAAGDTVWNTERVIQYREQTWDEYAVYTLPSGEIPDDDAAITVATPLQAVDANLWKFDPA